MSYGANPDPYVNEQTGVLRNSLGIANAQDSEEIEADLTSSIITILSERPVVGNFDLTHLKDIHGSCSMAFMIGLAKLEQLK